MWEFNWGIFWSVLAALVIYGVLKLVVKRVLGFYDPQWVHVIQPEREENEAVRQRKAKLKSMSDPKEWEEIDKL